jgi:acetyl-CoA C-acetyltransferase
MVNPVYIVAAKRSPIGSFGGSLSALSAPQLAAQVIKACLAIPPLEPEWIEEVYLGNVLSAGIGQAPARQAALFAGLPNSVDCTGINKVCASGSKAIAIAAQRIALGEVHCVIAGGMESMSQVPYYLPKARTGLKLGHGEIEDGIIKDGLWDVYHNYHMGNAAELTARTMNISREEQDAFAIESYKRSAAAWEAGKFDSEVVAIETGGKTNTLVSRDEEFTKVIFDKIPSLKPVFEKEGTITAANASSLNDGAAILILASETFVRQRALRPLGIIRSWADAAQAPEWFTTAPSLAVPKALEKAGIKQEAIGLYEINEAFSVVSIANNRLLNLNPEIVNPNGGAVSLGHPIGCSGARIVVSLVHEMQRRGVNLGVSGICNGGGGATALVIESV